MITTRWLVGPRNNLLVNDMTASTGIAPTFSVDPCSDAYVCIIMASRGIQWLPEIDVQPIFRY